jgi:hypothetical protein
LTAFARYFEGKNLNGGKLNKSNQGIIGGFWGPDRQLLFNPAFPRR